MIEQNEAQPRGSADRIAESAGFFDPEDQVSLRDIALVPWKRKVVVAGCTAAGMLLAILVCYLMHPKYRATAMIELNEAKSSGTDMLSSMASLETGDPDELKTQVQTEIAVIKDDSIALAVMGKMGMLRLPNPDRFSKAPG
ncbi:MAG: Wzz/FepE/Etk N-terminal domain-containing protein, partial [Terracidiphilus sp.]